MPHAYALVNEKSWKTILKAFQLTISKVMSDENFDVQQMKEFNANYKEVIEANANEISNATVGRIGRYINFYYITPKNGVYDEFKNVFFLGKSISFFLDQMGYADLGKLHERAMLHLLNLRLHIPYKAYRPNLSERISSAIANGKVREHFGEYGWYLIYKCLFNASRERAMLTAKPDDL